MLQTRFLLVLHQKAVIDLSLNRTLNYRVLCKENSQWLNIFDRSDYCLREKRKLQSANKHCI